MSDVDSDIKIARSIIMDPNFKYYEFSRHSLMYSFSNENLRGYYDQLCLDNKSVLTVASSGDHILNALLYGSNKLTTFDINRFTKYYFELKKSGICNMHEQEFLDFFYNKYGSNLDFKTYLKLRNQMNESSIEFWDSLYEQNDGPTIKNALFRWRPIETHSDIENFIPYVNEQEYYKLKNKLDSIDVDFIESDVLDINNKIQEKYDYILLSNISDYIHKLYDKDCLLNFKNLILKLSNNLKDDGRIVFAYITGINKKIKKDVESFYNPEKRNKIFCGEHFETISFDSAVYSDDKDAVMLYKK